MAGYQVKYTLATQLANELVEAADEMTLAKTIARYGRVDGVHDSARSMMTCAVSAGLVIIGQWPASSVR